ncbi:uncharacterized protein [Argopecten irradians]
MSESSDSPGTVDLESSRSVDLSLQEQRSRAQGRSMRGRGRGRGRRSRGRGARGSGQRRGRGRGRSAPVVPDQPELSDRERVNQMREERRRQTRDLIQTVPVGTLRALVQQLTDREPGLVFDLCEGAAGGGDPEREPGVTLTTPAWCTCTNCIEMPTDLERKCCSCLPRNCVSQRLELETLVLDPQVLALGHRYHRDMLGRARERVDNYNKSMRHSAYRNFTLWRHGRLGQGKRKVIPSCVIRKIRNKFPSSTNTYTGFQPGRFV